MTASETIFDLDAYLARIGYRGARTPTLETLRTLHLLHPQAIAFENLDPLLGRPVDLHPASLQRKLVEGRRGGYCFEQNLLFSRALAALGFRFTGLIARVLWNRPEGSVGPRTHMAMRVELEEGPYLADVGFGMTPTAPLRFEPGLAQTTPHERFRISPDGDGFMTEAEIGGEWRPLYRFDLQAQAEIDYVVANHYTATHPASHFLSTLIAARPTPGGRYALLNNRLTIYRLGGPVERRELGTAAEIRDALERLFDIAAPDAVQFDAALARLNPIDGQAG